MSRNASEPDVRIAIDQMLRQSGWDPTDRAMVGTEVQATHPPAGPGPTGRSPVRPFRTHAPVYDLTAAAGAFGPDRDVGAASGSSGGYRYPATSGSPDHFVARVEGGWMEPAIPDGSCCLFRADRGMKKVIVGPMIEIKRAFRRILGDPT